MKKILFVIQAVRSGGSVTSMLNLLDLLKEKGIVADIFLLQREGVFLERAEKIANVLPEEKIISSVLCTKSDLKKKGITGIVIRLAFVLSHKFLGVRKTIQWFYRKSAQKLSCKYETVVAYQESLTTEYVQYIRCNKRIAWVHNDYTRFALVKTVEQEQNLYDQYDEIVCVSQASKDSMLENLRLPPEHVHLIYNTIPRNFIVSKSLEKSETLQRKDFLFISVGRFYLQKGFDRAVTVAERLQEKGIDYIWYIIGDGGDFECIRDKIKKKNLEDHLQLLGLMANPFPYIKQADCFVLTSRYEAQPMVLNEALTLGIPVISTRFSSVTEVVEDGVNGLIVDNSEEGIYQGILTYINDEALRKKLSAGAKNFLYDNGRIINQVSNLL